MRARVALAGADELAALFYRAELSERYREVVMRRLAYDEPRGAIAASWTSAELVFGRW